jgi:predicted GIY-YIG superfamily endonuclease
MDLVNPKPWMCYCLESTTGSTYIGSSVDVDRRLRQHNGEIKGGARATSRGTGWNRVCHVVGFPDSRAALQFEWKWKRVSQKMKGRPIERRVMALLDMLNQENTTSGSEPFSTYDGPLMVFVEDMAKIDMFKAREMKYGILFK